MSSKEENYQLWKNEKFIADTRKQKKLTQEQITEKLDVSIHTEWQLIWYNL